MRHAGCRVPRKGARITFEPLNRYETPMLNTARDGLEFIDRVGADNLGPPYNTFHMNIEELSHR